MPESRFQKAGFSKKPAFSSPLVRLWEQTVRTFATPLFSCLLVVVLLLP